MSKSLFRNVASRKVPSVDRNHTNPHLLTYKESHPSRKILNPPMIPSCDLSIPHPRVFSSIPLQNPSMNSPLMVMQLILPSKPINPTSRTAMIKAAQLRSVNVVDLIVVASHVGTTLEVFGATWMDAGEAFLIRWGQNIARR